MFKLLEFVGPSGAGKSTLISELSANGHTRLSEAKFEYRYKFFKKFPWQTSQKLDLILKKRKQINQIEFAKEFSKVITAIFENLCFHKVETDLEKLIFYKQLQWLYKEFESMYCASKTDQLYVAEEGVLSRIGWLAGNNMNSFKSTIRSLPFYMHPEIVFFCNITPQNNLDRLRFRNKIAICDLINLPSVEDISKRHEILNDQKKIIRKVLKKTSFFELNMSNSIHENTILIKNIISENQSL